MSMCAAPGSVDSREVGFAQVRKSYQETRLEIDGTVGLHKGEEILLARPLMMFLVEAVQMAGGGTPQYLHSPGALPIQEWAPESNSRKRIGHCFSRTTDRLWVFAVRSQFQRTGARRDRL